jgi:hypothetical protein
MKRSFSLQNIITDFCNNLLMKKVFPIPLSLLMVVAMLHISVAMHYCEGKQVATTVSLTGKLASCGMECSEKEIHLQGTNFTRHCCDDVITFCGIGSDYSPTYSFVPESYQYIFQVLAIPAEIIYSSQKEINHSYSNVSPPGALMSTKVDLSDICVFRI